MSLKDLISTLIESAFTSKKVFIANTSAPNWAGKITIYSGTSANQVTQTAPADGYYQQHVNGYPSQGYNDISAPNETRAFVANTPESSAMIRVAKGDKVVMSVLSFDSIISRTIAFIPSIGGGLRSILQSGGALCLRLKTILHQSATLLTKDPFHQTKLSTFSLRKQPKLMSRPLMAMLSVLPQISLMLTQSILVTGNLLYRLFLATLMHGAVFGSRVKKGILLKLISRVLGDRHFDLYSLGMVQANLRSQGGAL